MKVVFDELTIFILIWMNPYLTVHRWVMRMVQRFVLSFTHWATSFVWYWCFAFPLGSRALHCPIALSDCISLRPPAFGGRGDPRDSTKGGSVQLSVRVRDQLATLSGKS